MQRNIITFIFKRSQATYFSERKEGGAKKTHQKFWKTIKPFLACKQLFDNNIILKEDDKIIIDTREIINGLVNNFLFIYFYLFYFQYIYTG